MLWGLKTASKLKESHYVKIGLQKEWNNSIIGRSGSMFEHCNVTDVKVFFNSIIYPYDNLNLGFTKNKFSLLYDVCS